MECKKFELTASAYVDRQLGETEAIEYREHLLSCTGCRLHLAETEAVSLSLRNARTPELPRELRSNIMREATRRARREITLGEMVFEWLLKLNPRPVGVTAGVIFSIVSFTSLFSSFRPIPLDGPRSEQAAIYPIINGSDREYHSYNNLPQNAGSVDSQNYYQLPRVLDNSALVSFSHIAYQKPGNQGMSALVEVDPEGRGTLVDMLDTPGDPYLIEQLWWSLRDRTFQPATVSGHPVPTRIILLVEKMDVGG
ncbi:MAG TPA: zf-HC2 domain-containing protein [Blastocatellia bacterium]|nr:zf-HC2 domain-containing protein [Blastocatellia bacterium]